MSPQPKKIRKRTSFNDAAAHDERDHHLTGPFLPQTPLGSLTPERSASPALSDRTRKMKRHSPLIRWAVEPAEAFKILLLPLVLAANWALLAPYLQADSENPFTRAFLITGFIPESKPDDPRYRKTYWDLLYLAYFIVFFSFVRESITVHIARPLAKYFGLRRAAKVTRFSEQLYALLYFSFFGAWGYRISTQLPTYWYNTKAFWTDYPHWDMKPEMKMYYLIQFAYWCQQLLVLTLGLEKPRKDYKELVVHHFVTLYMVGASYILNLTYIGAAIFMSMDIPDAFLAFSKILNYIQWNTAKIYSFLVFFGVWTYFRHYLNIRILWSVAMEQRVYLPKSSMRWSWEDGVYMPGWVQWQMFGPILMLQGLNLFWYYLMVKILYTAVTSATADDERSDDEGDDDDHEKDD